MQITKLSSLKLKTLDVNAQSKIKGGDDGTINIPREGKGPQKPGGRYN